MKLIRQFLTALVLSIFFASISYAGLEPATQLAYQAKNIPGIGKVFEMGTPQGPIYLAGKQEPGSIKELSKLKIKTFINLLPDKEMTFDEAAAIKKMGIQYVHIPVDLETLTPDTIKQFNAAIHPAKNYPVFIHCRSGERVAMMLAFNNITEYNVPVDLAIDEAKHYGLTRPETIKFIQETVKKYHLGKQ